MHLFNFSQWKEDSAFVASLKPTSNVAWDQTLCQKGLNGRSNGWLPARGEAGQAKGPSKSQNPKLLQNFWLVVEPYPSEKWWSSSVGMKTFPTEWKNKTCSKPPTRFLSRTLPRSLLPPFSMAVNDVGPKVQPRKRHILRRPHHCWNYIWGSDFPSMTSLNWYTPQNNI